MTERIPPTTKNIRRLPYFNMHLSDIAAATEGTTKPTTGPIRITSVVYTLFRPAVVHNGLRRRPIGVHIMLAESWFADIARRWGIDSLSLSCSGIQSLICEK